MSYSDELRILAEMKTFTQSDLARAIECTNQWASQIFSQLVRERVIHRVRVGHNWLYALTERGQARVAKMPAIDPEERCLQIERFRFVPESCPICGRGFSHMYQHAGGVDIAQCAPCRKDFFLTTIGDEAAWEVDDIPF